MNEKYQIWAGGFHSSGSKRATGLKFRIGILPSTREIDLSIQKVTVLVNLKKNHFWASDPPPLLEEGSPPWRSYWKEPPPPWGAYWKEVPPLLGALPFPKATSCPGGERSLPKPRAQRARPPGPPVGASAHVFLARALSQSLLIL